MTTTWRLEITPPPQPGWERHVEATVDEWARLSDTTPPVLQATPFECRYNGHPGYTVTAGGGTDAPPGWLKSLYGHLWGCGHFARLRKEDGNG